MIEIIRSIALFLFKSSNVIPVAIITAKILEVKFQDAGMQFTLTDSEGNPTFTSNFIEWFGILYGILLPLLLVRVWEQLDAIDREFDREADAVKLLYEDIYYLPGNTSDFVNEAARLLHEYVEHVIHNYQYEVKPNYVFKANQTVGDSFFDQALWQISKRYHSIRINLNRFLHPELKYIDAEEIRKAGDGYLQTIRQKYKSVISSNRKSSRETDPFISDVFQRLNDIVDIRGDRIGFASQRLFESLRIVALITSIIFVLPFYFVNFNSGTPPLDKTLIIGVTLLVIFIYLIIDDFDEPFGGTWRITDDSWKQVLAYMNEHQDELHKLGEKNPDSESGDEGDKEPNQPKSTSKRKNSSASSLSKKRQLRKKKSL